MLEFRVLGSLEVLRAGTPVDLGRRRERLLAAALLLSANRVVPAERLVSELWGETPPPAAASALRVHVSRLRRALGGEELVTRGGGYVLSVGPGAMDAALFESLVASGRAAAAAGGAARAAADLRAGLALWRGRAYADLSDVPSAAAESARLEEVRLAALEDRIDADLACGAHRTLAGELEALTAEHPLRERLWELRMLALYRAGRQAEALAAFRSFRRLLDAELGLAPGTGLRALEAAILRQDAALDPPAARQDAEASPASVPSSVQPGPTLATILVTDLVGSTALRASLGEERADELRRRHDDLLTGVVQARSGRVVKGTGDGLIVAFGSASDALSAAVDMQRAIEAENGRPDVPARLAVRIGLSVGDVAWDGGDCFGTPIVEATRLETHAEGGQIVCSDFVRVMARGRGGHRFRPLGDLDLKGLPEPVAACVVEWRTAAPAATPLPTVLAPSGRIFVGREAPLGWLRELWSEAAAGPDRRLALVAGEPGIGKTRLVAELAAGLAGAPDPGSALILAGRCDEDLGVPYQPFVEALRHFLAHAGAEPELGRHAGELARLVPELGQAVPGLAAPLRADPETEQYRLFDAVAAWLAAASARRPVLLVLDDLHWAAKPTLLMLRHLLRYGEPLRLLVVATYRDTDVGSADAFTAWAADLHRERGIERLALTGLDEAGVAAFVDAAREAAGDPTPGDADFVRVVWRETEGNPFFVTEVLRHLVESGAVVRRGDRWVATVGPGELGIPDGIRDVVRRRLGRLGPGTNRVLAVAAIAGAEFDPEVVRRAADVTEDDLFDALDEAVGARLLAEVPPKYRFAHALVRTTVHDGLGDARRRNLHGRVAAAIEGLHADRLDDHLPALAHHCAHAGLSSAADYAVRAGRRAADQLAYDDAVSFYREAFDLIGAGDPRHLGLMIDLGEAQRRAGDAEHREILLDAADLARRRGDAGSLARAALANARTAYFSFNGVDVDRVATLEAALATVPDGDSATRARLLATLAVELHWEPDPRRRMALSDEALSLGRTSGEPSTLAHVLLARPLAILSPATLQERLDATVELLDVAAEVGDPALSAWAHCLRSRTLLETGDVAGVNRHIAAFVAGAEVLRQPVLRWTAACSEAGRHTLAGRLDEAEQSAVAAFAIGRDSGQPEAHLNFWAQLFLVRFHQGRLAEIDPTVADTTEMESKFPVTVTSVAFFHTERGEWPEARAAMVRAQRGGFDQPVNLLWSVSALYGGAAVALGDTPSAARVYDQLHPYRDQVAVMGAATFGAVAHWLGLISAALGRPDEADAYFAAAADMHVRLASPPWLARTQLEWGETLLASGRPEDAARGRDLLHRALVTSKEFGLGTVDRRASALLA